MDVLGRIKIALTAGIPDLNLKPQQVQCFDYILQGYNVLAVLPTGFGKSLLFQLFPDILPMKTTSNIVIVICPLTSIIEDQLQVLKDMGINAVVFRSQNVKKDRECTLFDHDQATRDSKQSEDNPAPDDIINGNTKIIFAHPEELLSEVGRKLLKSDVFQDNVVACVIDKAHCVEMWGNDFRKDFKGLSCLKAFFPSSPILALTATAPPQLILNLQETLCLKENCKVIRKNPNKDNIFLDRQRRLSNNYSYESYSSILTPIAQGLLRERTHYPLTIIYMKLKYCGYAYALFDKVLQEKQFDSPENIPTTILFAQFHSPQTKKMKEYIIAEIKKENSRIRVIFETTALGMGVDAPCVNHIIHIGPPSNLESYFQEIGRAGRCGLPATATMCFNISDVANNKTNVEDAMKRYCQSNDVCLRKLLLEYFGFPNVRQKRCCCICNCLSGTVLNVSEETVKRSSVRTLSATQAPILCEEIKKVISDCKRDTYSNSYKVLNLY